MSGKKRALDKARKRSQKKKEKPFNPVILSDEFGQEYNKKFNQKMIKGMKKK